jgi:type 1 fimbria pilin
MKRNHLLVAFAAVLLLAGSVWAAGSKSTDSKASILKAHGTVVSSTSSSLVLSTKVKGKAEEETYVVDPQTKIKGSLTSGSTVDVRYKMDNGQKLATFISVHQPAMAKAKAK